MLGESCIGHPNQTQIDEMFNNGHTAIEVANWLKQIQKNKRLQISSVSLQYYRKNFLKLTRQQISEKRREMNELGRTHDVNVLTTFTAAKDFVDSKNLQTQEVLSAINDFKSIKDEALKAIDLIKTQTVDAEGKPVFAPRNYEIMEKFLGRLESVTNSFIKAYKEMNEKATTANQTNITISAQQIEKQSVAFKDVIKEILMELDPTLVSKFFDIYKNKMDQYQGADKSIKIQINNSGENNISITTDLPSEEEAKIETEENEREAMMENVIDIESEKQV